MILWSSALVSRQSGRTCSRVEYTCLLTDTACRPSVFGRSVQQILAAHDYLDVTVSIFVIRPSRLWDGNLDRGRRADLAVSLTSLAAITAGGGIGFPFSFSCRRDMKG
jgi:hypothetical protein